MARLVKCCDKLEEEQQWKYGVFACRRRVRKRARSDLDQETVVTQPAIRQRIESACEPQPQQAAAAAAEEEEEEEAAEEVEEGETQTEE